MTTASIVTYEHHITDIEPVLRSLFASPVSVIYIIDHSDKEFGFENELRKFIEKIDRDEPDILNGITCKELIKYQLHPNNGYGGGHNVALKAALREGSKYHLVVNPDVWFDEMVIPTLVEYMEKHDSTGHIMPKVLYPNGSIQKLTKLLPTPADLIGRLCMPKFIIEKRNARFELAHSKYNMELNVPFLSGCFMFFRMSAIEEVGMFDERFFMYVEDIDMSRRMHHKYETIYLPKIHIYHKFGKHSYRIPWLFLCHISSSIKYFNKWGWLFDKERRMVNKRVLNEIEQKLSEQR